MRRTPRLAAVFAIVLGLVGSGTIVAADDLPPGFTDGQPVGGDATATATTAAPTGAEVAAVTNRYFGEGAYAAVRAAVTAAGRTCTISDDGLTALVLAPVFKESSAATTASSAPAPMTLSRYDEWNGVFSDAGTPSNNYGLYAFRNPATAYKRAFWSPGLGIWQYDTAGVGAPLTTIEAMDVRTVSADVARGMATRYCNPAPYYSHSAPYTDQERRYAAWHPWGSLTRNPPAPCTLCEGFFDEMYTTSPKFANLQLVAGIDALGGVVEHTCVLSGVPGTRPCWYVEPRVGVIQGATAWATFTPDGGSNTVAPTPLPAPFYVVDRGTTEERHWLRADTGYGIDISASRTIGKDARPRSSQAGSGLAWSAFSGLCDLTTGRGQCTPIPPPGVRAAPLAVTSGYRPVALDADGDGRGDVLWYRPGAGSDALWLGTGSGAFTSRSVTINGTFDDVLVGDVDGDGDDDVLWYARASGTSYLWRSDGDGTFTSLTLSPGTERRPFLLDADGNGDDEVFWYGPGATPDAQWNWSASGFVSSVRSVRGTYHPIVGDLDGNRHDDILWYAAGAAGDNVWLHSGAGTITSQSRRVLGTYTPLVGDFDGDQRDDIAWYAPGSASDSVWFGEPNGSYESRSLTVTGTYVGIVSDLMGSGRATIIWYLPGAGGDYEFSWSTGRIPSSRALVLPGYHVPVVGGFSVGGADGILWYEPTLSTDLIWFR